MSDQLPNFVVRHVRADEVDALLAVHTKNAGEFLWPRTRDQFMTFITEGCLYAAYDHEGTVVGLCYITVPEDVDRYELGGIYLCDAVRGLGLGDAVAMVAIATDFTMSTPPAGSSLIAHVHVENHAPRKLLGRVGFAHDGKQEKFPHDLCRSMRPDGEGMVVGDVYKFNFPACKTIADWLAGGCPLAGPRGKAALTIQIDTLKDDLRAAAILAMRDLAER